MADADLAAVRAALLAWYDAGHRDLPWRGTRDPYAVLVSEVMLQQTQAARVAERFPDFMRRFPTPAALAAAPSSAVLAAWSGLGYNRRALALQEAARTVAAHGWPSDVDGLERLPGVGRYTARAIASLTLGAAVGAVDTNVRRWLVRRFGVADRPAQLQQLADALATAGSDGRSDAWTHASIELGATVCAARITRCNECPLSEGCPSRGAAVPVPIRRQAPLPGTDRAYRGAVLRHLSAVTGHAVAEAALRRLVTREGARIGPGMDDRRWRQVLDGLERDRLVHRAGGLVHLGAATIGA